MDAISYVIGLARLRASVDKRCLLAGATEMKVPAYGDAEAAFHFVLGGECVLELPDRQVPLRAGDAVLLAGRPPHLIRTAGPGPVRSSVETPGTAFDTIHSPSGQAVTDIFCGHYSVGSGSGVLLLRSLPDPLVVSFDAADESVRTLAALLRAEALADGAGTAAVVDAVCAALLAMMLRRGDLPGVAPWTAVADRRIATAIAAVLDDPGADWTLDRLAATASMSRATFVRHFGKHTRTTVAAFVVSLRMMVAADLLTDPELTVAAVAGRVGYHSESAFTRAFREATGVTPGRYRRTQIARQG
ncbi:AraC family transcriptional regulator [Kribbella sp. NPDC050241]|uniref:AraC family transcriptional regulator n=1 Tax=Kribbella sp. NPDC050241 TaxID=3364115 RepID=UPI003787C3D3